MKETEFFEQHWNDGNDNPVGGISSGLGFTISWQNGPLGTGEHRIPPNGAFIHTVIAAVIGRLCFHQSGKFKCKENEEAIAHLREALKCLAKRRSDRTKRGVEGNHEK